MNQGSLKQQSTLRIQGVLDFIHNNLDSPLSVDDISKQSCWSRWQLQRVFQQQTGLSVANYVRELKLSYAAERLVSSKDRSLDIALEMGFASEHAFSRAFKQVFSVSPREYRKNQQLSGLRKPFTLRQLPETSQNDSHFIEVKIETKPAFYIKGLSQPISGLFSPDPDFHYKVPKLWLQLSLMAQPLEGQPIRHLGVIDVTNPHFDGSNLEYWAGYEMDTDALLHSVPSAVSENLDALFVPKQTYAVITHIGKASKLAQTLEWFIMRWLPFSNYRGVDGYELEIYPADYQADKEDAQMQYWLPVEQFETKSR
ncbi:AraC family transcriptional regulator [Vibrio hyugaensis]|uniref:AraC family transcriptional regulator n=1 Tax=Vibrio hyugaensis TaxID=1534743 RepID=UPI000CE5523B|nr:AraC family transcriptional regulator [Vibrio hyugaensis]